MRSTVGTGLRAPQGFCALIHNAAFPGLLRILRTRVADGALAPTLPPRREACGVAASCRLGSWPASWPSWWRRRSSDSVSTPPAGATSSSTSTSTARWRSRRPSRPRRRSGRGCIALTPPTGRLIQSLAQEVRRETGASYIVVIDRHGIRFSHPDPALIGQRVSEPVVALDGRDHVGVDYGNLGVSANAKVPLRAPGGQVIGEVSAGIPEAQVSAQLLQELPQLRPVLPVRAGDRAGRLGRCSRAG